MKFVQEIYTYFLRCLDLNLNYSDLLQKKFQLSVWDDPDHQKFLKLEEETRKVYKDHPLIYKQKIEIFVPTLSMLLLSSDDCDVELDIAVIAELAFWNYRFEMLRFHDGRKTVNADAHSM